MTHTQGGHANSSHSLPGNSCQRLFLVYRSKKKNPFLLELNVCMLFSIPVESFTITMGHGEDYTDNLAKLLVSCSTWPCYRDVIVLLDLSNRFDKNNVIRRIRNKAKCKNPSCNKLWLSCHWMPALALASNTILLEVIHLSGSARGWPVTNHQRLWPNTTEPSLK